MKSVIQVMTHPFGACGERPQVLLAESGHDVRYNPFHRRLKAGEVATLAAKSHGIIAGTEPYTRDVIEKSADLKVIARVGVGLDSIDFQACRDCGVIVTYTPEAPADAVAELTVANILNLLRHVHRSDKSVREMAWNRYLGLLVREAKIGILGVGRIGGRAAKLLCGFGPELYGCDIQPNRELGRELGIHWVSKRELFQICDLVTIHVPLTAETVGLVGEEEIRAMKPGGFIVNTSRGKTLDEAALMDGLNSRHLAGAALDVFGEEPYEGPLIHFDNVVLTAHMGASARHSRYLMELRAAEDCLRVLSGEPPAMPVTDSVSEYPPRKADANPART